jgi:hypothetical protein
MIPLPKEQSLIFFKSARYLYIERDTYTKLTILLKCFHEESDLDKRRFFTNEANFLHASKKVVTLEPHEPVLVVKNIDDKLFQVLYKEQVGYITIEQEDMNSHMTRWYSVVEAHKGLEQWEADRLKIND